MEAEHAIPRQGLSTHVSGPKKIPVKGIADEKKALKKDTKKLRLYADSTKDGRKWHKENDGLTKKKRLESAFAPRRPHEQNPRTVQNSWQVAQGSQKRGG